MFVAICPTYRRPHCIPNVLAMWAAQDYPGERHLLIVDDGQTFEPQRGQGWTLVSLPFRLPYLGMKFAKCVELARAAAPGPCPGPATRIALFEDDDIYLPGYLSAHAAVLDAGYDASMPSVVLSNDGVGAGKWHTANAVGRHHGTWAFTAEVYDRCGGYPSRTTEGFDFELARRLRQSGARIGDPWPEPQPIPYLYRWFTVSRNGSAFRADLLASQSDNPATRWEGPLEPQLDEEAQAYFTAFGHTPEPG